MKAEIQEIITRVLNETSTREERKLLIDWMLASKENRKELENIESIWNALDIMSNHKNFNPEKGYNTFLNQINPSAQKTIRKKHILFQNNLVRVAASIIILVGISYLTYLITKRSLTSEIAYFELITPKGSHTQLVLTDGTKVWLNAGSKLRYPNKFDNKSRTVFLEGEAFFNVKKDPNHPFIVKTSDVDVKALGTSFNVKAYPNEGTIETILINGLVIVEGNKMKGSDKTSIKLTPSQKATFIKKVGKLMLTDTERKQLKETNFSIQPLKREKESLVLTKEVNTELYTSWVENRLVFENESFESIAFKLERRYGATIVFKQNEIRLYRFSGKFPEISIDRALNALQFASPFHYKIKQDTIFIDK